MSEKYEVISSSIHSILFLLSCEGYRFEDEYNHFKNYWRANNSLSKQLNYHFSQITHSEEAFGNLKYSFDRFEFTEQEFSLLILMIITRPSSFLSVFF